MSLVVCAASALTVAGLFYSWRSYNHRNERRHKLLRERVTYMLWVMVNGDPEVE
jgi:hypothetical protein